MLDERALRLSAGQRQKIALARLFLRPAPLLLLDEPTAHLDPTSAADVDAAIGALTAGRTVILVTHREAGLPGPGRKLVVSGGVVTELAPPPGQGAPASRIGRKAAAAPAAARMDPWIHPRDRDESRDSSRARRSVAGAEGPAGEPAAAPPAT